VGFEILLRNQSELVTSFDYMLHHLPTTVDEKFAFLESFEDLLRRQAILLSSFEDLLKMKWSYFDQERQENFLASFEDLIQREMVLLGSFEGLTNESMCLFTPQEQSRLLDSFEDLLRREAQLLKSYEELYKMTYGGISIDKSVDKLVVSKGDSVTYSYVVKNWFKEPVTKLVVIDDRLGIIAENITLGPGEFATFTKNATIEGSTCNIAMVMGEDPAGMMISDQSNIVCVKVIVVGVNYDEINMGNQTAISFGADPPVAKNKFEVVKEQKTSCSETFVLYNIEKINAGDQVSQAHGNGQSSNEGRIIVKQE